VQAFQLIPFPSKALPNIHINGQVKREENQLSMRYVVQGEIENLLLRPAFVSAARKDDLWQATCFEFFLAIKDLPGYWEFNMSPSSEWNVYVMDAYRRIGFREELSIQQLPFEFKQKDNAFALAISVDLTPFLHSEQKIQLGITAILQTKDGTETYWALTHPGTQADFHLRESFVIEL